MARRHNRKGNKSPVEQVLVAPETSERKVLLNPETNEYEPRMVTTPAKYKQGRALRPTTKKGLSNKFMNQSTGTKPKKESR